MYIPLTCAIEESWPESSLYIRGEELPPFVSRLSRGEGRGEQDGHITAHLYGLAVKHSVVH